MMINPAILLFVLVLGIAVGRPSVVVAQAAVAAQTAQPAPSAQPPAPAEPGSSVVSTNGAAVRLTPAYLNELSEQMRTNHPGLRSLAARVRAAVHATNAVRTWEDPMFKFGGVVASDRGPMLEEEGDLVYELEQKLPLFGRPGAARRLAQTESEVEVARQEMRFQLLRRDLAQQLFRTAGAEVVIEIGRRDLAWLESMAAATDERYRAGTATQSEYLRLQNERARRADMLRTDTLMRDQMRVMINRFLNRPLDAVLPRFELPEIGPAISQTSRLADYAVKFEPQIRVMNREVAMAEAQVSATRKMRLPEVSAGIEGRQYTGDGGFREGMFTVGLSLPWLNRGKYRSELARDRARLEATQLERADYQLEVRADVHRLVTEIDAARREALLYRDEIVPRARQAMESAHANWTAGRGMFLETMEARRMLLESELMQSRAIARQYEAMSELILCCGLGDFEALEMLNREEIK